MAKAPVVGSNEPQWRRSALKSACRAEERCSLLPSGWAPRFCVRCCCFPCVEEHVHQEQGNPVQAARKHKHVPCQPQGTCTLFILCACIKTALFFPPFITIGAAEDLRQRRTIDYHWVQSAMSALKTELNRCPAELLRAFKDANAHGNLLKGRHCCAWLPSSFDQRTLFPEDEILGNMSVKHWRR